MADEALVAIVKSAVRVTTAVFDDEIGCIIDACKDAMRISGVASAAVDATDPDPLIKRAFILYAKAEFGMDNPDSEKYMASFTSLLVHLALSSEYQETEAVS